MTANTLLAIINIIRQPRIRLKDFYQGKNRANAMGSALEEYIKDLFAGTLDMEDESRRTTQLEQVFSYLGNQNNPPDMMIRNGDAIEVKKIESKNAGLALNSSYPKTKLFADSDMITQDCRHCESWSEKDILYAVGVVNTSNLLSLCFVYGVDYAASPQTYERIKTVVQDGIQSISDVEFAPTKELARVNKIDPLGSTYLRVRGMWHIDNPWKTFQYIYTPPAQAQFSFMALINSEKYNSFPLDIRQQLENLTQEHTTLMISDVKIKIPDNPTQYKDAKLITFYY